MSVLLFSVPFGHKDGGHPVGLIDLLMCGTYVPCAKCVFCFLIVQYVLKLDLCLSGQKVKSCTLESMLK